MISFILCQNCSWYSTLTAIFFNNSFPSNTIYSNYIILKVQIKHIMHFGIFTAYQSLSTLICTSVFLLPETCLHVHFKNLMLKTYRCSVVRVYYSSIKSLTDMFSLLQKCHVRCNTVCCVLLWFKSLIITDIINISFIILCARLFCFFCFTNCFILR